MAVKHRGKPASVNANAAGTSPGRCGACRPRRGEWRTGRAAPQSWKFAAKAPATANSKPVDETRYYVSSLRTGAEPLLQHVRDRWSIENSWHWPRDTQLREDAHRYRENNGVRIMATLRSLAMNALRLDGYWSITEGLAALAHDIQGLLALVGWREPLREVSSA